MPVKDGILEYNFEDQDSPAGSVGCCSLLESDQDLQFLNDLGPKFKTLAEICVPPTPKPSLMSKAAGVVKTNADVVEQVVKTKYDSIAQTKNTDLKTEKVMSSTNISSLNTDQSSVTRSNSRVTNTNISNISHSSNISPPAPLPFMLQQPLYYTTSPLPQPLHYVVQPQMQNTVLLADGTHGAGLYVVSGSQAPSGLIITGHQRSSSGIVFQGIEPKSPKSPSSPKSPICPTLLLPGSPGLSKGSVLVDGWKIIGPNPGGNSASIKRKSSGREVKVKQPGSSRDTLSKDAALAKAAAPPQGALSLAAQGRVDGVSQSGGGVADGNFGQTGAGQLGQVGLGTASVLEFGVGAGKLADGVCLGNKEDSLSWFHKIPSLQQTADISVACRSSSPEEDEPATETTTALQEGVVIENEVTGNSDSVRCLTAIQTGNEFEEKQLEDLRALTSVQEKPDDHNEVQGELKDNEAVQEYPVEISEPAFILNVEEVMVKETEVLHKEGCRTDAIVPDQLNKILNVPIKTFIESGQQQEVTGSSDGEKNVITKRSTAESSPPSPSPSRETEETSTFSQEDKAVSTSDHDSNDEKCSVTEESMSKVETTLVEEGNHVLITGAGAPENRSPEAESKPNEQGEKKQKEDISPTENVPSGLETNQTNITDSKQVEEKMVEVSSVTSDGYEEIKDEAIDNESASSIKETVNESEEESTAAQEAAPNLQENNHEGPAETERAEEQELLLHRALDDKVAGELEDLNVIPEETDAQEEVEESNESTSSLTGDHSSGHEGDIDNEDVMMSGLGVDQDEIRADEQSEGLMWRKDDSQVNISSSDEEDKDIKSAHSQKTVRFNITDDDDDAVEDVVSHQTDEVDTITETPSLTQQNVPITGDQEEEIPRGDVFESFTSEEVEKKYISNEPNA